MSTPDPVADKLTQLRQQQDALRKCVKAISDYVDDYGCVTSAHIATLSDLNDRIRETIGVR